MATQLIDLGNLRFIWKGNWDVAENYELNDVVRYNNIVWVYINPIPSTGIEIDNPIYWTRMVEGAEIPSQQNQTGKLLKTDGNALYWSDSFDTLQIGTDITEFISAAGLTNVALGIQASTSSFAQVALVNTGFGSGSSADFIAYAANGTNESGWVDMGITNQSFNDPNFTLTGPGDGYLFMSGAVAGTVEVVQFNVAANKVNLITSVPHQMVPGVIFDLVLPSMPDLEGRYTVESIPTSTQIRVAVPSTHIGGNVALTDVINSQINKFTGDGNLVLATDSTGLKNNIIFASGGLTTGSEQIVITPDNGIEFYDEIFFGNGAKQFNTAAELTNAAAVFELNGSPYAQLAVHNQSANSSTDIIAYADSGVDAAGWIDMGITGSTFAQSTFGITGPHDGYIFMEAPVGTSGSGNLVLATGGNGTQNKIVFAAGGYDSGSTQMTIIPNQRVHIEIPTPSTSPSTGALTVVGGVGIQGDVNIAGNISFGGSGSQTGVQTLEVAYPIVFVGDGNTGDAIDLGLVGEYKVGSTVKYAGVIRDASDGIVKIFKDLTTKPTNTADLTSASYSDIRVGAITSAGITASGSIKADGGLTTTSGAAVSIPAGLTAAGGVSLSGTVDIQELREQVTNTTLVSNVGAFDWTSGNVYYIDTAPTANMTFNFTNVPTDNSKIMSVNVFVTQGSTGYIPTTVQINGSSQTVRWQDGLAPVPTSSVGKQDIFSFTFLRTSAGAWNVYASATLNF